MSQVLSWADLSTTTISEIAIRQQHKPAENFKFYSNNYTENQTIDIKASHAFRLYVLTGTCSLTVNGQALELEAEQYIQLKDGTYTCHTGSSGLSIVKVFQATSKK